MSDADFEPLQGHKAPSPRSPPAAPRVRSRLSVAPLFAALCWVAAVSVHVRLAVDGQWTAWYVAFFAVACGAAALWGAKRDGSSPVAAVLWSLGGVCLGREVSKVWGEWQPADIYDQEIRELSGMALGVVALGWLGIVHEQCGGRLRRFIHPKRATTPPKETAARPPLRPPF